MTRSIDDEEATISEEVVDTWEGAQRSPFVVRPAQLRIVITIEERFQHRRIRVSRISWQRSFFGAGSCDIRDVGKCGRIADVVKVNVADYDGAERVWGNWALRKQIACIFGDLGLKDMVNGTIEGWNDIQVLNTRVSQLESWLRRHVRYVECLCEDVLLANQHQTKFSFLRDGIRGSCSQEDVVALSLYLRRHLQRSICRASVPTQLEGRRLGRFWWRQKTRGDPW